MARSATWRLISGPCPPSLFEYAPVSVNAGKYLFFLPTSEAGLGFLSQPANTRHSQRVCLASNSVPAICTEEPQKCMLPTLLDVPSADISWLFLSPTQRQYDISPSGYACER